MFVINSNSNVGTVNTVLNYGYPNRTDGIVLKPSSCVCCGFNLDLQLDTNCLINAITDTNINGHLASKEVCIENCCNTWCKTTACSFGEFELNTAYQNSFCLTTRGYLSQGDVVGENAIVCGEGLSNRICVITGISRTCYCVKIDYCSDFEANLWLIDSDYRPYCCIGGACINSPLYTTGWRCCGGHTGKCMNSSILSAPLLFSTNGAIANEGDRLMLELKNTITLITGCFCESQYSSCDSGTTCVSGVFYTNFGCDYGQNANRVLAQVSVC